MFGISSFELLVIAVIFFVARTVYLSWINTKPNEYSKANAVVTGGSYGIGFEFAKLLAADGYNVLLISRNKNKLKEAQQKIQAINKDIKVEIVSKDLSTPNAANEVYEEVSKIFPSVDIFINNAGIGYAQNFHLQSTEKIDELIHLNITSFTKLLRLFLADMTKRNKGKILNIGSTAGSGPGPTMAAYYASKAYVISLSQAISFELRNTKVTNTVLLPGPTKTEFSSLAGNEDTVLFKYLPVATADVVAYRGYKSMWRGDMVHVPMWGDYILWTTSGLIPHQLFLYISEFLLKPVAPKKHK